MQANEQITDHENDSMPDAPAPEVATIHEVSFGVPQRAVAIDPGAFVHPASEIDRRNEWNEPAEEGRAVTKAELYTLAAEAFRGVIEWCGEPTNPIQVRRRLRVLVYLMTPSALSVETQLTLARAEGCTKAAISAIACQFRDRFHFAAPTMRTESARQSMSDAGGGNLGKTYRERAA